MKSELLRTVILFIIRIVRGFIVPSLLGPEVYGVLLKAFSISRFSGLLDFGQREQTSREVTVKNLKILAIITFSVSCILVFFYSILTEFTFLILLLVLILSQQNNLKFVVNISLLNRSDWMRLLYIDIFNFIVLIFGIGLLICYQSNKFGLIFIELGTLIVLIWYGLREYEQHNPSKVLRRHSYSFKSFIEFTIGNLESVLILMPLYSLRAELGILIGLSSIFLISFETLSNYLIKDTSWSLSRVHLVILVMAFIFYLSSFILFSGSFFPSLIKWFAWNKNLAFGVGVLLMIKLSYNYMRKLDLLNKIETKVVIVGQLILLGISLLTVWYLYIY